MGSIPDPLKQDLRGVTWHMSKLPGVSAALQGLKTTGQGGSIMNRNNEASLFPALGQVHCGRRYRETGDTGFPILSKRQGKHKRRS